MRQYVYQCRHGHSFESPEHGILSCHCGAEAKRNYKAELNNSTPQHLEGTFVPPPPPFEGPTKRTKKLPAPFKRERIVVR